MESTDRHEQRRCRMAQANGADGTVAHVVLMLLLGPNPNVSAIGLVAIPASSRYVIVELFGLIVALNVAYAAVFLMLERRTLRRSAADVRRRSAPAAVDRIERDAL